MNPTKPLGLRALFYPWPKWSPATTSPTLALPYTPPQERGEALYATLNTPSFRRTLWTFVYHAALTVRHWLDTIEWHALIQSDSDLAWASDPDVPDDHLTGRALRLRAWLRLNHTNPHIKGRQ